MRVDCAARAHFQGRDLAIYKTYCILLSTRWASFFST